MEEIYKPRRHWFRFSLRTMLVLLTLVCVFCGYLGWAMNWVRERRDFLENPPSALASDWANHSNISAPFPLQYLGAPGVSVIRVQAVPDGQEIIRQLTRLFPEANLYVYVGMRRYQADEWFSLPPADQVAPWMAEYLLELEELQQTEPKS